MRNSNDPPENLSVRARRGALLPGEQAELDRLLEASPTLRMAHQLGKDFDQIAAVQPGDEQRISRFVERALAARKHRRPRLLNLWRVSPWMAAATVFGICGVAFGLRGAWLAKHATPPVPSVVVWSSDHAGRARKIAALPPAVTEPIDEPSDAKDKSNPNIVELPAPMPCVTASIAAPLTSAPSHEIRDKQANGPEPSPVIISTPERKGSTGTFGQEQLTEANAAALLRQANKARSLGELYRTIVLLQELQSKFGNSPEARVSLVSLGKLLMLKGSPDAALQQFSNYLAAPGPLEEEALVGRAQALQSLGRASEERSTWERLLTRFPSSVYAGPARKRLLALTNGAAQ